MGALSFVDNATAPVELSFKQKRRFIRKMFAVRAVKRLERITLALGLFVVAVFLFSTLQSPVQVHLSPFEMVRLDACPSFFEAAEIYSPNPSADYISLHSVPTDKPIEVKSKNYDLEYEVDLFADDLSPQTNTREFHFDAVSPFSISYESTSPVRFGVVHSKVVNHQDHRHNVKRSEENEKEDGKQVENHRKDDMEDEDEEGEGRHHGYDHHKDRKHEEHHNGEGEEQFGPHNKHGKHHGKHGQYRNGKHHKGKYQKDKHHKENEGKKKEHQKYSHEQASLMGRTSVNPTGGVYKVVLSLPKNSTRDAKIRVKLEAKVRTIAFKNCPFSTSLREGQKTVFLNKHEKLAHIVAASPHSPSGAVVYIKFIPNASKFLMIFSAFLICGVILKLVGKFLIIKAMRRM